VPSSNSAELHAEATSGKLESPPNGDDISNLERIPSEGRNTQESQQPKPADPGPTSSGVSNETGPGTADASSAEAPAKIDEDSGSAQLELIAAKVDNPSNAHKKQ